jgi:hypothetical protein
MNRNLAGSIYGMSSMTIAHFVQIPVCNTIIRKKSFYPRTVRDWNALPTDTDTAKSLESFKTHVLD